MSSHNPIGARFGYEAARGVVPTPEGSLSPEDAIRKIRDEGLPGISLALIYAFTCPRCQSEPGFLCKKGRNMDSDRDAHSMRIKKAEIFFAEWGGPEHKDLPEGG